ncbi:MAG: FAD-dependent oxidoreductase [Deltaproteobacteria bacterium]|nr:MAG: FAD-dependent oxidoreductase [Deltaproteobacteria bacterium]
MLSGMLAIAGIGLVASFLLGIASKVFYVAVDPMVLSIAEALPGANCGACGFAGCSSCAKAIAKGRATPDACLAGGPEVSLSVAELMGVTIEVREPDIARLGCWYTPEEADTRFTYDGVTDCRAALMLFGGSKLCEIGCMSLGSCVAACPFGALTIGDGGLPEVNEFLCTGCGSCEQICPKHIIRLSSETRRTQHTYLTDECTAPCQRTCPTGIDIPHYIHLITQGRYREAISVIKETNPFPLTCGRVCPHPCEQMCRLGKVTEPVNINHLKRFVADMEMHSESRISPYMAPKTGKQVAIIGGGPAGLTCAFYLARFGHSPTIFEAMPELGGMLRYGIPEYRLPKKILDWEIEGILTLGVDFKTGVTMGEDFTLKGLKDEGFDAIFLGTGAWDSRGLGVDGEDLEGVLPGTHFLIDRGLGKETPVGDKVAIIGGGNTALDAARTSWRLGAKEVTILYRRSRVEMPANDIEIEEAEREGVLFHYLAAPTKLMGNNGKLTELEYIEMELGEPDESGRRRPVPKEGSEKIIKVDNVIAAIGQFPVTSFLKDEEVALTRWDTIELVNEATGETNLEGVFAGGDAVSGASIAIEAIGAGRRAARSIHQYLSGERVKAPEPAITKEADLPDVEELIGVPASERVKMPELSVDERRESFDEVERGLDEQLATQEAARCLRCGLICYRKEG